MVPPANLTASTPSIRRGYVLSPDGRGTLDIFWTCLITMFLGSWSALFLNLPGERTGRFGFFKNKARWMIVALLFPEMITALAAEQWRSSRQSVEDFKKLQVQWQSQVDRASRSRSSHGVSERLVHNLKLIKKSPWTMRHAFFADMGGIVLQCPDHAPFPVVAYQLKQLVAAGLLAYPNISRTEIWDRNKADGFARLLTLLQITWFFIQIIGRVTQQLAVTTLELSTLSFIFCTIHTLFFWTHKPLDVEEPIRLECPTPLEDILTQARRSLADPFKISPLDYLKPSIKRTSMVAPFWNAFEICFASKQDKHETPPNSRARLSNVRTVPPRCLMKLDILYVTLFVFAYFGIHLIAWDFVFPTPTEHVLWRVATCILLGLSAIYCGAVVISSNLATSFAKRFFSIGKKKYLTPIELPYELPRWLVILIYVPFFVTYVLARLYIILEGFCHLRALSETAYSTIKWENFLPHLS